jgi:hypothetical protein
MEQVVPWAKLEGLVESHYPKGENGRPPVGLGIMLRIYFVQQWFNLSDPGAEEALYDSPALRRFPGWIWDGLRRRMRPRSASSGTYWKSMIWAGRCWMR